MSYILLILYPILLLLLINLYQNRKFLAKERRRNFLFLCGTIGHNHKLFLPDWCLPYGHSLSAQNPPLTRGPSLYISRRLSLSEALSVMNFTICDWITLHDYCSTYDGTLSGWRLTGVHVQASSWVSPFQDSERHAPNFRSTIMESGGRGQLSGRRPNRARCEVAPSSRALR